MKNWTFLIIIAAFGLLQITALNYINVYNAKPDLLLITVVVASLFFEPRWALFFSIFAGFIKDILSPNTFGINTFLFPLWGFLIMKLSKRMTIDNNFIRAAFTFIIVILNDMATIVIFLFLGNFIYWGVFLRIAFLEALYTASVLPLMLKIIRPVPYS